MERIAENSAQFREGLARRLELSALRVEDDRVCGTVDGFEVALVGEAPFRECHVTLAGALPLAMLRFQHGDLNHPDAVETGDPAFDEVMQVVALPGHAPTIEQLLADEDLRTHLRTFLKRFPESTVRGNVVVLKVPEAVSHETLVEVVALARALSGRFARVGFLTTEDSPVVGPSEKGKARATLATMFGGAFVLSWWGYASFIEASPTVAGVGTLWLLAVTAIAAWLASRNG